VIIRPVVLMVIFIGIMRCLFISPPLSFISGCGSGSGRWMNKMSLNVAVFETDKSTITF
jgi:hypothetical protein